MSDIHIPDDVSLVTIFLVFIATVYIVALLIDNYTQKTLKERNMIKFICITILFLCTTGVALAEGNYQKPVIHTQSSHQYMVSAILRKNDHGATVKLIQSIEKANSEAEASGILLNKIKIEFVGYSVLDSIVTLVPEAKNACENWI